MDLLKKTNDPSFIPWLPKGVSAESFATVLAAIVVGFLLKLAVIGPESGEDLPATGRALWPATSRGRAQS